MSYLATVIETLQHEDRASIERRKHRRRLLAEAARVAAAAQAAAAARDAGEPFQRSSRPAVATSRTTPQPSA